MPWPKLRVKRMLMRDLFAVANLLVRHFGRGIILPGAAKKQFPKIICCFLSNRLEFQCEILLAYM